MFIPLGTRSMVGERPQNSEISTSDWKILADYWYPVAIAHEISNAPLAAKLLDVDVVLYRGATGRVSVAVDICPHRHVRLSRGSVIEGEIVCPFHGLRFDGDGRCQRIPVLGPVAKMPQNYKVKTFPAEERYGLVWTCLGDPAKHAIPIFPKFVDIASQDLGFGKPLLWPVSAPRQIENFADLAHLPFVHAKTLGGDPAAAIEPGHIEHTDDGFIVHAKYDESAPDGGKKPCEFTYRVVLPFAIEFKTQGVHDPDYSMESCNIPSPVSAHQCQVFQLLKGAGGPEGRERILNMLVGVNAEDIGMLDGLMISDMPLDQHHEIHLPVDNVCNAYRSRLRALGLGRQATGPQDT